MEKIWLAGYPAGIPHEIDAAAGGTLVDVLERAFQQHRRLPAFQCLGKQISYQDLDHGSRAVAAWLSARGLGVGKRVALMSPNVLSYPVVLAGILRAGCTLVSINPLYTPRELEHQLKDSGAEAIFIFENFAATLDAVNCPQVQHVVVTSMGDLLGFPKGAIVNFVVRRVKKLVPPWRLAGHVRLASVLAQGAALPWQRVQPSRDDVAMLQYTGGTTGVSKGAMLLHRNIVANVLQIEAWIRIELPETEHPQVVCALPLYHIFALTFCGLVGLRLGACNLLIPNPRDLPAFIKTLRSFRFSIFPGVNTLFNALLHQPAFATLDFSSLRMAIGGGMAVQSAVAARWQEITGRPIIEGYGLSETSPVACCGPANRKAYSGTIGLPVPSTEVSIRDDEGVEVPLGTPGEICIRGPQVMAGYWQRPADTQAVMTADGYFRSGDIGVMDAHGDTRIIDRKKDMILVSGFNVYPAEVEEVVTQHPGVLECVAVGVPDEHSGELVKVVVVRSDPALSAQDVRDWCKTRLTGYKRPHQVEFRTELPKSNVGKVLRRVVREESRARSAA